ncbi:MAG: Glucodextranase, domain [Candidatus Parcubacteria bacterium]|jgi:cytoskeletal protein RodZ
MNSGEIKLGYILTKYRLKLNLTVNQLASKLSTPSEYIYALEKGNYRLFKSLNEATPILKKLSYVLGLKYGALAELYNKEYELYASSKYNNFSNKKVVINQKFFKKSLIIFISTVALLYLVSQIYQLGYIPVISLNGSDSYEIFSQENYSLSGTVNGADYLTLNGQKVTLKEGGSFEINILLRQGENRLELQAIKDNKSFGSIQKIVYKK